MEQGRGARGGGWRRRRPRFRGRGRGWRAGEGGEVAGRGFDRDPAPVLIVREVLDVMPSRLDAPVVADPGMAVPGIGPPMPLVEGLVDACRRLPVDRPEVLPQGLLIVLERSSHSLPALPDPQESRLPLGVQGIQGDDPAPQVEFLQQGPHDRDFVGTVRDFDRSQGDAGTVLEVRDPEERAPVMLSRRAVDGLAVQRHRPHRAPLRFVRPERGLAGPEMV